MNKKFLVITGFIALPILSCFVYYKFFYDNGFRPYIKFPQTGLLRLDVTGEVIRRKGRYLEIKVTFKNLSNKRLGYIVGAKYNPDYCGDFDTDSDSISYSTISRWIPNPHLGRFRHGNVACECRVLNPGESFTKVYPAQINKLDQGIAKEGKLIFRMKFEFNRDYFEDNWKDSDSHSSRCSVYYLPFASESNEYYKTYPPVDEALDRDYWTSPIVLDLTKGDFQSVSDKELEKLEVFLADPIPADSYDKLEE
jgi:hypothetical protein